MQSGDGSLGRFGQRPGPFNHFRRSPLRAPPLTWAAYFVKVAVAMSAHTVAHELLRSSGGILELALRRCARGLRVAGTPAETALLQDAEVLLKEKQGSLPYVFSRQRPQND